VKSSTPWIVALLASVLINGALAGFVLHRASDGPDWRRGHEREDGERGGGHYRRGGPGSFDLRAFVDALPEETRDTARQRLFDNMPDMRAHFEESREARRVVEDLLTRDTVDRAALDAALEEMRQSRLDLERNIEAIVLDIVSELDPETRAAALEASRQRSGHRRYRRHGERGPDALPPPDGPPPERPHR
jgi:uncharacterized membrane protein